MTLNDLKELIAKYKTSEENIEKHFNKLNFIPDELNKGQLIFPVPKEIQWKLEEREIEEVIKKLCQCKITWKGILHKLITGTRNRDNKLVIIILLILKELYEKYDPDLYDKFKARVINRSPENYAFHLNVELGKFNG